MTTAPPTAIAPLIPIARPEMDEREVAAARRAILSGWVTQGPEVERFETAFAAAVSAPYACAVSSGTAALHLAMKVAGVGLGDEVITVSHSFIATTSCIRYVGARPVFVDIEPGTFNMDPSRLEDAITARTRAILCVHQLGMPCDLRAILEVARRHDLVVVEDAACAAGSEILWQGRWERIGRPHADIACFSFHPRKVLTTGEGGMVTTARADWDATMRRLRQHGMSLPAHARHTAADVAPETYLDLGYNYRLTDIQAAIGQVQIERLPEMVAARRRLAAAYAGQLTGHAGLVAPVEPAWARSNWQGYCVRLPENLSQHTVMQHMRARGVATRMAVMCAHREPACPRETWSCGGAAGACDCGEGTCRKLRESERARDHAIQIPLFPGLADSEQARVVVALLEAVDAARAGT
ncbi:MAG TPA: DegT/DnrJ/EryC1/StrS family aminotransferase [Gemmatimonadaceae bacterium]